MYATTEESYDCESDDDLDSGTTEQSEFLVRCKRIYDPESGSSCGATHVLDQISTILSPRTLPCCDSGLPRDTKWYGYYGKRFGRPRVQEGLPSTIFHIEKNLASSSQESRHDISERDEKRIIGYADSITSLPK